MGQVTERPRALREEHQTKQPPSYRQDTEPHSTISLTEKKRARGSPSRQKLRSQLDTAFRGSPGTEMEEMQPS